MKHLYIPYFPTGAFFITSTVHIQFYFYFRLSIHLLRLNINPYFFQEALKSVHQNVSL
jgi:hypothetical protein